MSKTIPTIRRSSAGDNNSIGKALAHEGKTDEAKQFLVGQLKSYINDPQREAVEQLLQQLVQLCAKRPPVAQTRTVACPPPAAAPALQIVTAATPPPLPPYDASTELEKQMAPLQDDANATGNARLLYAKAELATLRKKPDEHDTLIGEIADRYKPGDLDPLCCSHQRWVTISSPRARASRAGTYYTELKGLFPEEAAILITRMWAWGKLLLRRRITRRPSIFSRMAPTISRAPRSGMRPTGKAKTLLELGNYDEARKLARADRLGREWRGESTAYAVYSLR